MDRRQISNGLFVSLIAGGIAVTLSALALPDFGILFVVGFGMIAVGLVGVAWQFFNAPRAATRPEPHPAIQLSGSENVLAVNPVNSQTAHTIVNEAPRPRIVEGRYEIFGSQHRQEIEIVAPYPIQEFIVVAYGDGIQEIEVLPHRPGLMQTGWTGVRPDRAFTSVQQAQGRYTIVVTRQNESPIEFRFSVDEEIR